MQKIKKYQPLLKEIWELPILQDVNLKAYTSFGCNSKTDILLRLNTREEFIRFLTLSKKNEYKWVVLGKGSNCIFTDEGLEGVVLILKGEFKEIYFDYENCQAICGSAVSNSRLAKQIQKLNWEGGEFLATIPGTVGGGVTMNAGAYGLEYKDIVINVEAIDLAAQEYKLSNTECDFRYRESIFTKNKHLICKTILQFRAGSKENVDLRTTKLLQNRLKTQPLHAATWGSVFKNPSNAFAGRLIEDCGLKGKIFGQVKISELHANFIENLGRASFVDIKKALFTIKEKVYARFKINLELEVRILDKNGKVLEI